MCGVGRDVDTVISCSDVNRGFGGNGSNGGNGGEGSNGDGCCGTGDGCCGTGDGCCGTGETVCRCETGGDGGDGGETAIGTGAQRFESNDINSSIIRNDSGTDSPAGLGRLTCSNQARI